MKKLWMSWSSGKDSAFALLKLQQDSGFEVSGLFTTVNESVQRVAMHSTRNVLLQRQAAELGLPLELVNIPGNCTNETYEAAMSMLIRRAVENGVEAMGFGDIFLKDIRQYRERLLASSGIEPIFPLWQQPTEKLAHEMISVGIGAMLTCIDPKQLARRFAGCVFDRSTLAEFPPGIDLCGENGEFHTFVFSSPSFRRDIPVLKGEVVEREGFVFADVLPV